MTVTVQADSPAIVTTVEVFSKDVHAVPRAVYVS